MTRPYSLLIYGVLNGGCYRQQNLRLPIKSKSTLKWTSLHHYLLNNFHDNWALLKTVPYQRRRLSLIFTYCCCMNNFPIDLVLMIFDKKKKQYFSGSFIFWLCHLSASYILDEFQNIFRPFLATGSFTFKIGTT